MDLKMFRFSPWRFVTFHVLFSMPRHPFHTFYTFRFLFIFLPACLMSLPVWHIGFVRRSIQNCQYESTPYSFPEVNTFKLLSFISGRGIWTPDMQIMILLFLPTKLSRLQKKEESRALPLLRCSIGSLTWAYWVCPEANTINAIQPIVHFSMNNFFEIWPKLRLPQKQYI